MDRREYEDRYGEEVGTCNIHKAQIVDRSCPQCEDEKLDDGLCEWEARAFTLDTGYCPQCEGTNLNEDRTKCFDCDAQDYTERFIVGE